MPVALLAGGLATRLYPLTEKVPKSLIEVAGKPFIFHQMELFRAHGITDVVICAGHLGEQIRRTLGDGLQMGLRVQYVFDGPRLLGTGGALKRALPLLGEAFFVLYGDSFLEIEYEQVERAFSESSKLGLMTVYENRGKWDRSNVLFSGGQIVSYDKKNSNANMHHIDYGLGVLSRTALDDVPEGAVYDLAEIYRALVQRNQLAGYEAHRRFYEIGSSQGLAETRAYLAGRYQGKD
jgi:NDP-sugar pyrophosphorylase family protein